MECTVYTNAQNLLVHKEEIHHLIMRKMNFALMKTRLNGEINDNEVSVPGYSMVRCDSNIRNKRRNDICEKRH